MHRLIVALLLAGAGVMPAQAQRMAPDPLLGMSRPANQDLTHPDARRFAARAREGFYADRARRAERQAQFNRHFTGAPVRLAASRR